MEILEPDEWLDDDRVATQRAKARDLLSPIVQQVRQGLAEAAINLDVFLMVPNSGDAIATFGTMSDPPDDVWREVSEIVSSIVQEMVGTERLWFRQSTCASTADPNPADTPTPCSVSGCGSDDPMKYGDIERGLPDGYPVLAQISIDPVNWFEFERRFEDTPVTRIIGHDAACNGRMVVRVACASRSVQERLQDGWE